METERVVGPFMTVGPFMSVSEVVRLFKVHRNTVYNWIYTGQVSALKVGRIWHIRTETLGRIPDA